MSGNRRLEPVAPAASSSGWVVLLSIVALVVSIGAVAFTFIRTGAAAADTSCRTLAWDALPDGRGLPDGWTVTAGNFYADGAGNSIVGPEASDGSAPDTLYLQVTCYGDDGHLAMTRSHQSALATGATDATLIPLGDESFSTDDPSNGSTSVYIRKAGLVAVLVAPTTTDPGDLETVARAVETALTAAGSSAARPPATVRPVTSPSGGIDLPSAETSDQPSASDEPVPSDSHVAPELEALLPKAVAGVTMARQSTTGTDGLSGGDASSQALVTSLGKLGKTPADLRLALAYDETRNTDLQLSAFQVPGLKGSTLGDAVVASFVAAQPSGITTAKKTIGGKAVTQVMYNDGGADDYVYVHDDVVFDVSTTDPASAIQAFALLP
jgi:hypothetical protein